jgi:hypothetical protein
LHLDGRQWLAYAAPLTIATLWGAHAGDLWVGGTPRDGGSPLARFDGHAWQRLAMPEADARVSMLMGTAPNDVWVGSDRHVYELQGMAWSVREPDANPPALAAAALLWAAPGTGAWVGQRVMRGSDDDWTEVGTRLSRWDGTQWVGQTLEGIMVRNLWASCETDVWATGTWPEQGDPSGAIFHFDGTTWTRVFSDPYRQAGAIAGRGPNDVWFIYRDQPSGYAPKTLHWDGSRLSEQRLPVEEDATAVAAQLAAVAGSGVWMAGSNAVVLQHP